MYRIVIVSILALAGVLTAHIETTTPLTLFASSPAHAEEEVQATRYACPMHPQIIADAPGTCPICGMDLVPMESGHTHTTGHAGEKPIIALEPGIIQTMNVRTEPVRIQGSTLTAPSSAILRSSEGSHVIVAIEDGRFQGRNVTVGQHGKGRTTIRSGLQGGEKVVTRAQFMIDAESNLREALDKFEGGGHAGH